MDMPDQREREIAAESAPWQEPLIRLLCDLARARLLIVLCAVVGVSTGAMKLARTPKFYRSTAVAVLLPREKPITDTSVNAGTVRTNDDSAVRADSGSLMLPPNPDLYIELIHSRSVLEGLLERFGSKLPELASIQDSDARVTALRRKVGITGTDEGIISITVTANDPLVSAEIANDLVSQCESASKRIERQLILQQAGYLERAVEEARAKVDDAQVAFERFAAANRLIDPSVAGNDTLRLVREAAADRERILTEIEGLLVSRTERDPEVRRLRAEIEAIDRRHERLRASLGGDEGTSPAALLAEFESLRHDLDFRRDLLATLEVQADVFRIRAEQPAGSLAFVRAATPPRSPAGPSRKQMLGVPLFAGLAVGVALALALAQLRRMTSDPRLGRGISELIGHLLPRPIATRVTRAIPTGTGS